MGSDLSLKFSLKDGLFPWLETPNKLHDAPELLGSNGTISGGGTSTQV